ncbi:hypothetical protein DPEC_G00134270 [Dallia pectoralis]|uniref:Uncharacterized protein n=1 Tax=Dallia pectoralis TaxID=75939 RepID=A0ACC2GS07_DALPE|nr:hypothetical protein DPEC_G00134270 [Dallia pectoralis]
MASSIPPPEPMKMSGDLSSNWASFRAEFDDYILATGLCEKDADVQAATLRRLMGSECRHLYKHNLGLTQDQQKDVTAILEALEDYFTPTKNVIFERYVFGNLRQEEGEAIDAFVTRLREKAATCEYGTLRDQLIRDRLVLGITDEGARRRLLREKDLTLAMAVDICRGAEIMDIKLKTTALDTSRPGESLNAVEGQRRRLTNRPFEQAVKPAQSMRGTGECRYCGTQHRRGRDQCPAFGKACRSCGTPNHFAKVCMKRGQNSRQLHTIDGPSEEDQDDEGGNLGQIYTTMSIGAVNTQGKKWFVNLPLQNGPQRCQLDSGATCNVMSIKDKMRLSPRTALQPSRTRLKLYNSAWMNSMGLFSTQCVIRGKRHKLDFEIVQSSQRPLLSGSTCEDLGLIRFTIPEELNSVEHMKLSMLTKESLISTYHDVFNGPIDSLPGNLHFELDDTVAPVQCAPRNVPVALKAAVKAQLDQHERDGHLVTVTQPTDWISNLVIVKKPEKLRLCIDPRPLNRALKRSHYLMPTLDDVLYKLPKARIFTLVDARGAFLQCRLDEESSLMTTFWTPWGRKRWLKLPFGVSVAPELYQRKQHELLVGLKGIEPIADDILIVGCGDTEEEATRDHDANLTALMDRCREVKLRLSLKKLQFRVKEVRFHGHVLSAEGLKADPDKRFHYYLYGRDDVTAETDHRPLVSIFVKPLLSAPKRLQSMLLTLQNYCLKVVYKPGPEILQQEQYDTAAIQQTDYLNVTSQRLTQIRQHTEKDECLQTLKTVVLEGWPDCREDTPIVIRGYWAIRDEISVQDGVLFRSQRVIIPKTLQPEMLRRIHYSHIGGEACYRQARDTLFWPNMQGEIKDFVQQCSVCNEYAHEQQKETMMSHPLPKRPWQIVSMDLFNHAGKDFLLVVDHYSDFWEVDLLPDLSAETTILRCKAQFARHGIPDRVICDCGCQFACGAFRTFANEWSFEHVTSSPRHPKANGKAESAVKIVKNLCRRAAFAGEDPWKAILHWRNTPTEGLYCSPAQRLMSRRLRTHLPVTDQLLTPRVINEIPDKLCMKRRMAKLSYDRSAKDLPELNIGQPIRMKPLPGDRTGRWRKGVCLQQAGPRSYVVNVEGTTYRRNRVDLRPAERVPQLPLGHLERPGDAHATEEGSVSEDSKEETGISHGGAPHSPQTICAPHQAEQGQAYSRSGRLIKPRDRLNL